jgi:hypothetical protein
MKEPGFSDGRVTKGDVDAVVSASGATTEDKAAEIKAARDREVTIENMTLGVPRSDRFFFT